MYAALDAAVRVRCESRLYFEKYWQRYFDLLASSRINNLIVIFGYENGGFMGPLYPYFFNVPEYPGVELVGITPAQQARNTAAFKAVMRIAHERRHRRHLGPSERGEILFEQGQLFPPVLAETDW
jgi:hypothetical protein